MNEKLNPGESFPNLSLNFIGGKTMALPGDLDSPMTIALFYRGHW
jgi:hypothetical protein